MLNKATTIMNQLKEAEATRLSLIEDARKALVILGAEEETTIVNNSIVINKGKIVEVNTITDNTDYNTINTLKEELNNKETIIADLKAKLDEALNRIAVLEKLVTIAEEEIITKTTKGIKQVKKTEPTDEDILVFLCTKYNIPEELRNHEITLEMIKEFRRKYNMDSSYDSIETKMNNVRSPKNALNAKKLKAIAEEMAQSTEEEIAANYEQLTTMDKDNDEYSYGVQGTITIDSKTYTFKWTNAHMYPCLFGCMDKEIMKQAKEYLVSKNAITITNNTKYDVPETERLMNTIYDFNNSIVIYKVNDHIFKGYTDKYAFVWDTTKGVPCGATLKNALSNNYRKMNASWGNGFVARAQMIKEMCEIHFPECFESTEEETIELTNEAPQTTEEEIDEDELL